MIMLKCAMICFLKDDNEDESFKTSARESHSLMDDGIQDCCEIVVRLLGTVKVQLYFQYFSKGYKKLH